MVQIRVHNVVSQVFGDDPRAHAVLHEALAYRQKNYQFSPAYKNGTWDGFIRLYNKPDQTRPFGKFWTGLLHRVATTLAEQGIAVEMYDDREAPPLEAPLPFALREDRYYQAGAEAAAVERTRGLIRVATAGGKTTIAERIIARLNQPTCFIVHKISLLDQAREDFEKDLGIKVGVIGDGMRRIERFNVATVQTLDSALWNVCDERIKRFVELECRLLLVDEVHHAVAPSYKRVVGSFLSAYYRFGMSATTHRHAGVTQSEDMVVEGLFGRVIHSADRGELVETGFLAKAHVFFL